MGRSQVKYNQTHGRPGAKGRGGGRAGRGGSVKASSQPAAAAPPPQPSHAHEDTNAWRYENRAISYNDDGMDLEMLELETQRLTQYPAEKVEQTDEGHEFFRGVDLSAMGKALDNLSVADRLGIPTYLTVDLEVKGVRPAQVSLNADKSASHSTFRGKIQEAPLITKDDIESQGTGDEDEDLDSWLDSVIT